MLHENLRLKRKERGLSQEELASRLHVVRQTISKWETNETIPDLRQSKKMAMIYGISLDELIDFDIEIKEIEEIINRTDENTQQKIDWTNAWGKKYPVLLQYRDKVNIPNYASSINTMLDELKQEYQFSEQDAMLVLKDILYHVWKKRKHKH